MERDYHLVNESRDGNKGQPTRPGPPTVSPTAHSAVLSHFDSYQFNFQNLSRRILFFFLKFLETQRKTLWKMYLGKFETCQKKVFGFFYEKMQHIFCRVV